MKICSNVPHQFHPALILASWLKLQNVAILEETIGQLVHPSLEKAG
jgi:hypothetical protein